MGEGPWWARHACMLYSAAMQEERPSPNWSHLAFAGCWQASEIPQHFPKPHLPCQLWELQPFTSFLRRCQWHWGHEQTGWGAA